MCVFFCKGGAITPVGDPPNVIVASNAYVIKSVSFSLLFHTLRNQTLFLTKKFFFVWIFQGVNFFTFSVHMSIGIILVMVQTYIQLRYKFRNINDLRFIEPQDIQELRHEIAVWQRAASSLSSYSKDEDLVRETLVKKVNRLQRQLKKKLSSGSVPADSYKQTLQDLQRKVRKLHALHTPKIIINSSNAIIFSLNAHSIQFVIEHYWWNRLWHWCLSSVSSSYIRCQTFNDYPWVGRLY